MRVLLALVITHGNGPQVGNLLVKNELAAAVVPPVPLDWCGARVPMVAGRSQRSSTSADPVSPWAPPRRSRCSARAA